MHAIILVGLARSGKDTAADFLAKKFHYKKFVFSDFLAAELKKKKVPLSKHNLSVFGDELRKKNGMAAVAGLLWKKAKKFKKIVLVGARSVEEINYVKKKCKNTFVAAITAPVSKRFARRSSRDPKTRKDFLARDKRDIRNKGLNNALKLADFTLQNNGTVRELREKILKLALKLEKNI
ncbi:MAG: AAA family ATPase [Candidatus Diapherotrites archaeon]